MELAQQFAGRIQEPEVFELVAPARLSAVCFRHTGDNETTTRLIEALNKSGGLYMTHISMDGRFALRFSIGALSAENRHMRTARDPYRRLIRSSNLSAHNRIASRSTMALPEAPPPF